MQLSFNQRIEAVCKSKKSYLCIGLDIDPDKLENNSDKPLNIMESFGKEIIDGTIEFCPIYKPNFAFYERYGSKGYAILERLVEYIDGRAIVIADAKRGDIGNSSIQYASAILDNMGCDAITVSPYMGSDSIKSFINNSKKGIFILAVTSNSSAGELQFYSENSIPLYQKIVKIANKLNYRDNIGLVVGATQIEVMKKIKKYSQNMPWLIPGIGAQGGDLESTLNISHNNGIGVINVSRSILYAGGGNIKMAIQAAKDYTEKIRAILCNQANY